MARPFLALAIALLNEPDRIVVHTSPDRETDPAWDSISTVLSSERNHQLQLVQHRMSLQTTRRQWFPIRRACFEFGGHHRRIAKF